MKLNDTRFRTWHTRWRYWVCRALGCFYVERDKGRFFFFEKKKQKTFVCCVIVFAFAGCSSPEPEYYSLQPMPGPVLAAPGVAVEIARPGLAGYLDRSGIVLQQADYKLAVDRGARWGEPLADMIGRVLAADLAQRLPASRVVSADGAIAADAELRIDLNVEKFDKDANGSVSLSADVAILRASQHRPIAGYSVSLHVADAASGPTGLTAAMSELLGKLADQLGVNIATAGLGSTRPTAPPVAE